MKTIGGKIENAINNLAMIISGTAFTGMVILISSNVISRYFFKTSLNWAEELSYLLFNWAVFLGVTIVYRSQGLIAIDILVDRLPRKAKKLAMIINFALISTINISLVVWGFTFAMNAWVRKSPSLGIPYFYYDISIPVACLILTGYSLKFLYYTIKDIEIQEADLEERV